MLFDFLFRKKNKDVPAAAQGAAQPPVAATKTEAKKETLEERIEREMRSLPSFIKNRIKDPSVKEKFIQMAKRMEKDGVNLNSPSQMKKWVKEHESEIKAEQQAAAGKAETVIKAAATGRNEPCPCGSGKKYKKCCGA
jgi:uncharacterized protein YecA (UPF0149 family)